MLSDHDTLLAAICANPEEDTPRLMLADWLDENGDPDRAEFIRAQCELARFENEDTDSYAMYAFLRDRYPTGLDATDWARIDVGVERLIALEARTDELLKQHRADWLPQIPTKHKVEWDGFRRGFPHRATLDSARGLKGVAARLRAAVPPVTLVSHSQQFTPARVEELDDAGLLGWITKLEVCGSCAAGLRAFGHHPEAAGVRALEVRDDDGEQVAAALADSPHWTGLRALDLPAAPATADDAEALFRNKNLHAIRRLMMLADGDWTADTVRAFAASGFGELRSLELIHCDLDDDAAEALAGCPALANLRALDLTGNRITGSGVAALLCSPHLVNLVNLCLDENPCNGLDAKRLATAPPAALRLLHFHGCRLRTADVRALARCPRLRTLWYFDLDDNGIGTPAVRELVRGFGKWCPPILWLIFNRIDDRGAELLANWKAASQLSALHLKYNTPITEAGVRALLDSPNLKNLSSLGVPGTGPLDEPRFRERFKHPDGY